MSLRCPPQESTAADLNAQNPGHSVYSGIFRIRASQQRKECFSSESLKGDGRQGRTGRGTGLVLRARRPPVFDLCPPSVLQGSEQIQGSGQPAERRSGHQGEDAGTRPSSCKCVSIGWESVLSPPGDIYCVIICLNGSTFLSSVVWSPGQSQRGTDCCGFSSLELLLFIAEVRPPSTHPSTSVFLAS